MSKKKASSKKKATNSKKKTKDSTGSPVDHSAQGSAEDQDTFGPFHMNFLGECDVPPVGIRAEGMPKFDLNSPTANKIQAAAKKLYGTEVVAVDPGKATTSTDPSTESLDESATRAKKAVLETHEKLMRQETPPIPVLQEKILVPTKLEICSCEYRYGVFASVKIDDGEIIEEAPFIVVPIRTGDAKGNPKAAALLPHVSPIACACQECRDLGLRVVLSSGYIQMYNHSDNPNARLLQHKANKRIYTIEALKTIEPGEQIFINYGPGYPREWLRQPHLRESDV
ncbi:hypothetical protein CMI47_04090 [Candidatus Pacearchaeota archaeon]|jgi:hypothetical protein|nr:hypothetical protein [Candidatus Pacearchaeota archaeon]|tara:strand:- start:8011 stop:8859 length:849 start_codon:yes stop_codon:yes gene_type:complete